MVACVIGSFLQGIAVFGATVRSTYSLSWIVYSYSLILLGPPATLIVVLVSHLAEWVLDRNRLKWYIQAFNISTFFIAVSLAGWIMDWGASLFAANNLGTFSMTLIALAAFTLFNHLLVGWVIKLARGQSIAQSGVFGRLTLILDFSLLCLGYAAAIIWQTSPIALTLVAFVAYMLYEALTIPALERKSVIDSKTELFNARYFTDAVDEELTRAKRFKRPLSLIMADLDFLRNINNNYGHLAGDVVLQGVARILQELTREYDVVSRFGGEEFAVMLPETEADDAFIVAEKIRKKIELTEFVVTTSEEPIRATMSFGIAGRHGDDQTTDNLIHQADVALYQSKENGRNRTYIYDRQQDGGQGSVKEWARLGISIQEIPEVAIKSTQNGRLPTPEPLTERPPEFEETRETAVKTQTSTLTRLRKYPDWATTAYIAGLAVLASILSVNLAIKGVHTVDWFGLIFFAIVVLVMEALAIEIYVRDSSVSTSAALLVAGVLLFGSMGAIVLGVIIAFVAYAKKRTQISRFIFNASNHTIGGLLIASFLGFVKLPADDWTWARLLIIGAGSASLLYLSTTILLTIAIGLSDGKSFKAIWVERFRWLAPYYLALGAIASTLFFSYHAVDFTGIVIVILPLLLLRYSQKQYIHQTETLVHRLQESNTELLQKSDEITLLNEELLLTLARSIDLRDPYVMEHSKHVSRYAVVVAEELGLSEDQIESIRKAGLLHDIGKLGIPEEILFKPGRLSVEEFEMVQEHVKIGAELIRGCHSLEPLAPFVYHHHEWFNGSGYPHGLAGDAIPLEARILSLADAVEAMASDRPYKEAMSPPAILAELNRWAGSQFDPVVAKAFTRVVKRQGEDVIVNSARDVLARQTKSIVTYPPHY